MPNWEYVLKEILKERDEPGGDAAIDKVRKKYHANFLNTQREIPYVTIQDFFLSQKLRE